MNARVLIDGPSELVFDYAIPAGLDVRPGCRVRIPLRRKSATGTVLSVGEAAGSAARERLEQGGLVFSGMSPDGLLPEIVERPDHPWFVGVQFHPELKSKPFDPHPLFASFIAAALKQSRLV